MGRRQDSGDVFHRTVRVIVGIGMLLGALLGSGCILRPVVGGTTMIVGSTMSNHRFFRPFARMF